MYHDFSSLTKLISQSTRILVATHTSPDGDALGSVSAFLGYLQFLNKEAKGYCADNIPDNFKFLPWIATNVFSDIYDVFRFSPDLVVLLDIYETDRAIIDEYLNHKSGVRLATLDHHLVPSEYDLKKFDFVFIERFYSSTTHILAEYFESCNFHPSSDILDSLLFGIMTDTEVFTNSATTDYVLKTAYKLLKQGARFSSLLERMRRFRTTQDLKEIGKILERLIFNEKYKVLIAIVEEGKEDFAGGIANYLKRVYGVNVVFVIKSSSDQIKVSMRSLKNNINVAEFAQIFGGGGHKMAAGFSLKGILNMDKNKAWIE